MGLETKCTLRLGGTVVDGKAHLDSERLTFRGGAKLDLRLANVKSAEAGKGGMLVIKHGAGVVTLGFGDRVSTEKWALKIRSPKSLIDKLGLKPESRVAVLGVADEQFLTQASGRLRAPPLQAPRAGLDYVFYAADSPAELARLSVLKRSLQPAGAIWVVSLKGKAAKIRDTDVMQAAHRAGLVDVKVCSFSATHTALKLVIPKSVR